MDGRRRHRSVGDWCSLAGVAVLEVIQGQDMKRLLLWTLLGLATFSAPGCIRQDGGDSPSPPPAPGVDAGVQARAYLMLAAEAFDAEAEALEMNPERAQYDSGKSVNQATSEAREKAFMPLSERMNELRGENWSPIEAAKQYRTWAAQMRRVAE